jgi:hypothetical protein
MQMLLLITFTTVVAVGEGNATAEGMFIYEGLPLGTSAHVCICVIPQNDNWKEVIAYFPVISL